MGLFQLGQSRWLNLQTEGIEDLASLVDDEFDVVKYEVHYKGCRALIDSPCPEFDHTCDDCMLPPNHLDPEEINDLGKRLES